MKEVLLLIPNLKGGGAERVVVDLVNNFKSKKYNLTLMTLYDVGINKELLNDHVRYKFFRKHQIRGIWRIYKLIPAKILHRIIIRDKYDIEIAYLEGIVTKIISGGNNKVKKIAWLHCELTNHEKYFLKIYGSATKFRCVYSKFNKIACVSKDVRKSFSDKLLLGFENLAIVHNVIDQDRILGLADEINSFTPNDSVINFVSVGRLVEQKGYKRLLSVFRMLKDYPIHLHILGDGPDYEYLCNYIKDNNLRNVTLLGFIKNPYSYMKKMDCYICSSFQEGYSTAVAEALILHLPVISSKCSGSEELCSLGRGIVCENSESGIHDGILEYLNDNLKIKEAASNNKMLKEDALKSFHDLLDDVMK